MALIECIECSSKISDKALQCPKCGCEVPVKQKTGMCSECSSYIPMDSDICPECGFPNPINFELNYNDNSKKSDGIKILQDDKKNRKGLKDEIEALRVKTERLEAENYENVEKIESKNGCLLYIACVFAAIAYLYNDGEDIVKSIYYAIFLGAIPAGLIGVLLRLLGFRFK